MALAAGWGLLVINCLLWFPFLAVGSFLAFFRSSQPKWLMVVNLIFGLISILLLNHNRWLGREIKRRDPFEK